MELTMDENRSIWEPLVAVGTMIGMVIALILFMSFPYIITWISGVNQSDSITLLEKLPPDSKIAIEELGKAQLKIQGLLSKIQEETQQSEILLEEKKKALSDIQKKIDMLKLTPDQIKLIEDYNKSVSADFTLSEWVKRKITWYQIIAGFIVSLLFYRLGIRRGEKHKIIKVAKEE
jgi:hypothetical protein